METELASDAPSRPRCGSRLSPRRAAASLAVLATAALLAGCGTASSTTTSAKASATTTSTTGGQFNQSLVPTGGSSPGTNSKSSAKKKKSSTKTSSKSDSSSSSSSSSSGGTTAPTTTSSSGSASTSADSPAPTVTVTNTLTRTVTDYVRPDVPAGAGLPSRAPALSFSSFATAHGNIGCRIRGGTVRCDVGVRVWTPPSKPASCHAAWGQGLYLGASGRAQFVCARSSVLDPTGDYIRAGYDDKVGSVTCQVRSFGVTCFESDGQGFFISRTGYTIF